MSGVLADVLSGILVFAFGGASIAKLLQQNQQVRTADKVRIPWNRYRWIAVPEAMATIGLLAGYERASFGAAAGIGLAVLMAGAPIFCLRIRDSPGYVLGDASLLGLAAATAALRIISG